MQVKAARIAVAAPTAKLRSGRPLTAKAIDVFGRSNTKDGCHDAQLGSVLGAIFREVKISSDDVERVDSPSESIVVSGEVPRYVEVQCERFPQVRFGLGEPRGAGTITMRRSSAEFRGNRACEWRIDGALSLILSTAGMTRVGLLQTTKSMNADGTHTSHWQLPLDRSNLKALIGTGRTRSGFPLGSSVLRYKQGVLRCTLELDDTVYRVMSTGLLMTFGSLHVVFGDGTPRVDFREGRLWKSR